MAPWPPPGHPHCWLHGSEQATSSPVGRTSSSHFPGAATPFKCVCVECPRRPRNRVGKTHYNLCTPLGRGAPEGTWNLPGP